MKIIKKLNSLLRSKTGFTLVEVTVSSTVMISLISIFSLIPIYKAQLATVTIKETAHTITRAAISELEKQDQNSIPSIQFRNIDLSGNQRNVPINKSPKNLAAPIEITKNFGQKENGDPINMTFDTYVEVFNINAIGDPGSIGSETINADGSNTCRVSVIVAWRGRQCGSVSEEHTINNNSIDFSDEGEGRITSSAQCNANTDRNRCFCTGNPASCGRGSCRCQTN